MDYEALKEQWSEVEDRDGVRLSWNVLPSSRMVCNDIQSSEWLALTKPTLTGSVATRCAHWRSLHSP